jgi:hypothetical protein
MYKIFHNIHLSLGLLLLPFVFIYAVSSIFFAHPEVDPSVISAKSLEHVSGTAKALKKLHKTSGMTNPDTGIDAWGVYILAGSVLLLLICLTGIYLWLKHTRDRLPGVLFLLTSSALGISLLAVIRFW